MAILKGLAAAALLALSMPAAMACDDYDEQMALDAAINAAKLAQSTPPLSAIICLGVIFQGQTSHAQHVGWGVTHALAQIQVLNRIPVVHGVFVFENEEHARVRCLGNKHNRLRSFQTTRPDCTLL